MCTCSPHKECTEDYYTASSGYAPTSTSRSTWRTAERSAQSDYCSAHCSAPSTPKSQQIPPSVPMAPLRVLKQDPNLSAGVAIASRRIHFDRMEISSTFEETMDDTYDDLDISVPPRYEGMRPPLAASSPVPPEPVVRRSPPGTYELRRTRPPQFPTTTATRQYPRMTQMTPCGKCLRM
ncbi:uncharacterized protein LOC105663224 [Megachile rotundata]|uniref:uncharacterized protein LOC105663224 n=1 Tax=Megachile rotundata TaxID=143995 RepID=UPI0006153206|nr:PREDICTED: uncharacterized protein LOC105663224 isoform X2 [Megachile rotundata]